MIDLAYIAAGDDVLLLGIGSGYHAPVPAQLAGSVRVVDIQRLVAVAAIDRLFRLGYEK